MAEVVAQPEAIRDRLEQALRLHPARAVVAILEVPSSRLGAVREAIRDAGEAAGIEDGAIEVHAVSVGGGDLAWLAGLNRERDLRIRVRRALVFLVADAPSLRLLRETAPDLTAATDVWVAISPSEVRPDWSALASSVRDRMASLHGSFDLTGLLPGSVEKRVIEVDRLYMDLLDLGPELPRQAAGRPGQEFDAGDPPLPAWLLLADPGAGKTTALRRLAWTYAGGRGDPLGVGPAVPILLPLAELAVDRDRNRVRPLVDFLPDWLREHDIAGGEALRDHLREILLLLDGLDEMREPGARRSVAVEVAGLVEQGKIAGVVLSGRSYLVDELRGESPRFRAASCRAPSPDQIRSYLERFLVARGTADAGRVATELADDILADRDLGELARTPLLLVFLALLHEIEGRLPDRRIEVYDRLAELLVERWVRARSLSRLGQSTGSRKAGRGEAWRVLGPLAWWFVERGGGAVPEVEIETRLCAIEALREEAPEAGRRARELLDLLRHDSALLRPEPRNSWAFVHPSVAEFFAARDAARDPDRWSLLIADPFRPEWREIVAFAAGFVGIEQGNTALLDQLVEAVLRGTRRAGRYEARHPSLLVGLLVEDPLLSSRQKRALAARLCEFWFTNAFHREVPRRSAQPGPGLLTRLVERSADRVQAEAAAFLSWGAGSALRDMLAAELAGWFAPQPSPSIRWDRLLAASRYVASPEAEQAFRFLLTHWAKVAPELRAPLDPRHAPLLETGGPLLESLPALLPSYDISPEPLLSFLRGHADWRLRAVAERHVV